MTIHKIIISGEVFKVFPLGTCACGCGKELVLADKRGRLRRYLHGHNTLWKKLKRKYTSPGLHQDTRFCYCGKQLDKWHKRFCSRECKSEYSKEKLQLKRACKHCKKEYYVYKSWLKSNASGNFCSKTCYANYLKTITGEKNNRYSRISCDCDYCGKEIKVIPFKVAEYPHHFCSLKCKHAFHVGKYAGELNPNWRGGHIKHRKGFSEAKSKHFNKKNLWCAVCGTFKHIHIHHIIPFRLTRDNDPTNLIPLCRSCHRKIELITYEMLNGNFENKLDTAKLLLNGTLRTRQIITYQILLEIKESIIAERRQVNG